ncbi:taste receptor type 2 member 43-like [Pseudophryne corroboree]|uniref:taste receptor type 2 member 43-like n=1 Tax=Pseudophryne corroboree TaxID=495146 RepID=UPI0030815345
MNRSMDEEYNVHLSWAVASGITCTAALVINGFIVSVIATDWIKQRPVMATDQILTSLGITRIIYQSVYLLDIFFDKFFIKRHIIYMAIVYFIYEVSFYVGICLVNLLTVVFCLKIYNSHNAFFRRLKMMILQRVVCLIIAYVLIPICYFAIFVLIAIITLPQNVLNTTYIKEVSETNMYTSLLWDTALFLVYVMSSVLLISVLCHHMKRMSCDRAVTGQLDTYYKIIKFSAFSLFSYIFYFVARVTLWLYLGSLDDVGIHFIMNVFPTLHSVYLIYVTARLRTCLSAILQQGTKFWLSCRRCYPEDGDPVETITQRL